MRAARDLSAMAEARVGKKAPRKRHQLTSCHCGAHVFSPISRQWCLLVSPEDVWLLREFWWSAIKNGTSTYAESPTAQKWLGCNRVLHRVITEPEREEEVDHRDRNGLNDTRENLRIASKRTNQQNSRSRKGSVSIFKGVSFDGRASLPNPWKARIKVDGREVWLGRHATEAGAAAAYDEAARKYFGDFARVNGVEA